MQKKPLVIFDGSHNPAKLGFLAENLKKISEKKIIIFGMAQDKDLENSLKAILPQADILFLTRFLNPYRKSADLRLLAALAKKSGFKKELQIFLDPRQALTAALKKAGPRGSVIICGSFFLAGELRKNWISEEFILKNRRPF